MSDTSVALFITLLAIVALCVLVGYAVRRVGSAAPGRLAMVIGGLVAFAAALPALALALRATPASEPANAPAPHASVPPSAPVVDASSAAPGATAVPSDRGGLR
ncbi:hypothetical protein OG216_46970 (plasmid) [Streptomycetaceae bacterium NBC_01309]